MCTWGRWLSRIAEGFRCTGAGVRGDCEPASVTAENQIWVLQGNTYCQSLSAEWSSQHYAKVCVLAELVTMGFGIVGGWRVEWGGEGTGYKGWLEELKPCH